MTRRHWSRVLVAAMLAVTALWAAPQAAHAGPPPPDETAPGRTWKVTLLTGDVVTVRRVEGRPPLVSVTPAPGRKSRGFRKEIRPDGHVIVIPLDMRRLVGEVIDPGLFDVTNLVAQEYDDARSGHLPLIVQRSEGANALSALGGTLSTTRELASIDAVAARQPKKDAGRLGAALARMAGPSVKATGGIRHIWLDRKVTASLATAPGALAPDRTAAAATGRLDGNLRRIGAPDAWRAGFTGRGATIAVLDTGVDAGHPDLEGRVVASKNFSESADATDRFGHGTHVAAIAAGSGAASRGERKGVAFGAEVLNGKVLNDDGTGTDSGVIAGMEWAASRADVVNMSLGGPPSDGTDPLSRALNRLTREHGTLFVVAAGNAGAIGSVGSPGTADAALTVGAVDADDRLARFSSRGPRGHVAKPEIVAPGVEIVAARAGGTALGTPIGPHYTRLSGTSMATPHVAGAAAALAAKHADWRPGRLKAALVGTADPVTGGDVYERGGGRLDVGEAAREPVLTARGVVDLGASAYPEHGELSTKLGWTSRARHSVRLKLSVEVTDREGRTADGVATIPARVDVPAGGTAASPLTVDASRLAGRPGLYTAVVTAKGGGATLETPVTFYVEPPSHTLTLKASPLPGTDPANFLAYARVMNLDDIALYSESVGVSDGTAELRVPEGRYAVLGGVDDFGDIWRSAITGDPEVLVDRDMTVTLDGAAAVRVGASVEGTPTEAAMSAVSVVRTMEQGMWSLTAYSGNPAIAPVYVQPMDGAETGRFRAYTSHRLTAPGTVYDVLHPLGDHVPADPAHIVTAAERKRMAHVHQRFAAFAGDTNQGLLEKRYGTSPEGLLIFEGSTAVPSATTRTDHVSTGEGMLWMDEAFPAAVAGDYWVDQGTYHELRPGQRVEHTWGRQPLRPGPYSGTGVSFSSCAPDPTARTRRNLHVDLVDFQTRPDGFDCELLDVPGTLALYAGGRKLGETDGSSGDFTIPARRSRFRLTYENDASSLVPVSIRTSTSWTFRSRAPRGDESARVPLLIVDYDLNLDLRNQPTDEPAVLTVARVAGTGEARNVELRFWTSADDGATWKSVKVKPLGDGEFSAPLPAPVKGQAVSLRVSAEDSGGNAIDQRIIRAYRIR